MFWDLRKKTHGYRILLLGILSKQIRIKKDSKYSGRLEQTNFLASQKSSVFFTDILVLTISRLPCWNVKKVRKRIKTYLNVLKRI